MAALFYTLGVEWDSTPNQPNNLPPIGPTHPPHQLDPPSTCSHQQPGYNHEREPLRGSFGSARRVDGDGAAWGKSGAAVAAQPVQSARRTVQSRAPCAGQKAAARAAPSVEQSRSCAGSAAPRHMQQHSDDRGARPATEAAAWGPAARDGKRLL